METWPIANVMLVKDTRGGYILLSHNGRPVILALEQKLARGISRAKSDGLVAIFLDSEWRYDEQIPPVENPIKLT